VGSAEIEEYRKAFRDAAAAAQSLTEGLTEAQFNWRPTPDHWSIEECLAHLTAVGLWELSAIEEAIDRGRERGLTGAGPFEYGNIDRFIVGMTEPPVRDRMPAPRRFTPVHGQPVTAILPTFQNLQGHFIVQTERAEGLHLARIRVRTPIFPLLKMSLGMTFAQIAAHQRRHLQQARRVWENIPVLPTTAAVSRR
jgi:DinB superfamily